MGCLVSARHEKLHPFTWHLYFHALVSDMIVITEDMQGCLKSWKSVQALTFFCAACKQLTDPTVLLQAQCFLKPEENCHHWEDPFLPPSLISGWQATARGKGSLWAVSNEYQRSLHTLQYAVDNKSEYWKQPLENEGYLAFQTHWAFLLIISFLISLSVYVAISYLPCEALCRMQVKVKAAALPGGRLLCWKSTMKLCGGRQLGARVYLSFLRFLHGEASPQHLGGMARANFASHGWSHSHNRAASGNLLTGICCEEQGCFIIALVLLSESREHVISPIAEYVASGEYTGSHPCYMPQL